MKIAAITRFRQGDLFQAMRRLGLTQSELARATGVSQSTISQILRMRLRPSVSLAEKIEIELGRRGEYVDLLAGWPKRFRLRTNTRVEIRDIPENLLLDVQHRPVPQIEYMRALDRTNVIDRVLQNLTHREERVIRARYGIGCEPRTLEQLGEELGYCSRAIASIENKALNKLRHPAVKKQLEEVVCS